MGLVKTTVNIDEETLKEFKRNALARYGGSRKLSLAIEDSMKNFNTAAILIGYAKRENILLEEIPSSREVMDRRSRVDWSMEDELRAMRDERAARISR